MKQFFCRSGVFHIFKTLGIFLTSLTLLSACSSEVEDFYSGMKDYNETLTSTKDDSVLRFKTIDELENLSVSEIPGDNDGFELKELSYECVDTIELRALRFDVKAKLCSSSNQEKIIGFAAEVGPELVSVEYYPGGEVVPAHHNMKTAFYPKVERYRNYSDGSRIGPDEFYDYGHFLGFGIGLDGAGGEELFYGVTDYCFDIIPNVIDNNINPESEWYENGIYYSHQKSVLEYNLNTTVILDNGKSYSGEDLLPIQIFSGIYDPNSPYIQEDWLKMINNYYQVSIPPHSGYGPELIIENNDSEMVEMFNLCCDVKDLSPKPYPKVDGELMNGWYWCPIFDRWSVYAILNSNFFDNLDSNVLGYTSWGAGCLFEFYTQYLVIDGRIIHYDDVISKDYSGIKNIKQSNKIVKDSEGYLVQFEAETSLYGERFKSLLDLQIRIHNGVPEVIDRSQYNSVKNSDIKEIHFINDSNTRSGRQDSRDQLTINENRKPFTVDMNLPKSISCVKKYRTIKKQIKK